MSNLGKRFRLFANPLQRLRFGLLSDASAERVPEMWALRDISFKVARGESYGIIGRNGSGKSTLLKLICGVMRPTEGSITTRGRVLGLLELGTGLNLELTGRQNVIVSSKLLGFPDDYARTQMAEIEAYADIGEFFDLPVKLYSSGMLVRLSFSLYLYLEPDVLIVDEALSVGDHFFQQKCVKAMADIRARGTTMLFVSHDLGTVRSVCSRALLLDQGRIAEEGAVDDVLQAYLHPGPRPSVSAGQRASESAANTARARASIESILTELAAAQPQPANDVWRVLHQRFMAESGNSELFFDVGARAQLQIVLHAQAGASLPKVGVELLDRFDRAVTGGTIAVDEATRFPLANGREAIVVLANLGLDVCPGSYVARVTIEPGAEAASLSPTLTVSQRGATAAFYGIVGLPAEFSIIARSKKGAAGTPASTT